MQAMEKVHQIICPTRFTQQERRNIVRLPTGLVTGRSVAARLLDTV
jgi:hypothetical protein